MVRQIQHTHTHTHTHSIVFVVDVAVAVVVAVLFASEKKNRDDDVILSSRHRPRAINVMERAGPRSGYVVRSPHPDEERSLVVSAY